MVEDGDFFGPQNQAKLKEKMSIKLNLVFELDKECKEKSIALKEQKECIKQIAGRTKTATNRLAAAKQEIQDAINKQLDNDKSMSSRFGAFEEIASKILPRDLSEIALIRSPVELVRHCSLAFGLLIGATLHASEGYTTTKKSMKKWYPQVRDMLLDSATTIKRINLFSWAVLLSPHSHDLCMSLDVLNTAIQRMIASAVSI
jgi:hypothetical protein